MAIQRIPSILEIVRQSPSTAPFAFYTAALSICLLGALGAVNSQNIAGAFQTTLNDLAAVEGKALQAFLKAMTGFEFFLLILTTLFIQPLYMAKTFRAGIVSVVAANDKGAPRLSILPTDDDIRMLWKGILFYGRITLVGLLYGFVFGWFLLVVFNNFFAGLPHAHLYGLMLVLTGMLLLNIIATAILPSWYGLAFPALVLGKKMSFSASKRQAKPVRRQMYNRFLCLGAFLFFCAICIALMGFVVASISVTFLGQNALNNILQGVFFPFVSIMGAMVAGQLFGYAHQAVNPPVTEEKSPETLRLAA